MDSGALESSIHLFRHAPDDLIARLISHQHLTGKRPELSIRRIKNRLGAGPDHSVRKMKGRLVPQIVEENAG